MSLSVHKLNADSTFLLTWSSSSTNTTKPSRNASSSFTVLVDPWLDGTSTIYHPKFALAHHTTKSVVQSLGELEDELDLIIISQGMDDHCHRETLCSLPANTTIPILAAPKAAKMIASWNHFQNDIIQVLKPYNPSKRDTITRLAIDPTSPQPGQLTVSNICPKLDLTGLHNAIGMTYTPPNSTTTLSALYTPHGTPLACLQPYINTHLCPLPGALPVTALFHSLNNESNPWFFGGEICAGTPAAAQLAREVGVKNWIGAHDEEKDVSGFGTKLLRSRVFGEEEARALVKGEGCEVWVLGSGGVATFS